jgi:hypothetical protein
MAMPTMAAMAPANARVPMAKTLMLGVLDDCCVVAGAAAPTSEAGIGGIEVRGALEAPLAWTEAGAPWATVCPCPWMEFGGSPLALVGAPEEATPAPYGIIGYPVCAVTTMLRLVCGGMRSAVALSYT